MEPRSSWSVFFRGISITWRQTKIYVPAASSLEERTPEWRHNGQYQLIACLAPNATIAMARAQIASLNAEQLQDKRDPFIPLIKASGGFFTIVSGLQEDQVETVKPSCCCCKAPYCSCS